MKDSGFTAIILAAGSGKRVGGDKKKQYIDINKKPLIYYTLKTFQESPVDDIILVVPKGDVLFCEEEIVKKYGFDKVKKITEGGEERYDSVYNALKLCEKKYVLIQDGARIFTDFSIVKRCIRDLLSFGSSVTGVPSKDTIKEINEFKTVDRTLDRNKTWIVQTPQCFLREDILYSYERLFKELNKKERKKITDDAMVLELFSNIPLHMTMGDYKNIKITTKDDLNIAREWINNDLKKEM